MVLYHVPSVLQVQTIIDTSSATCSFYSAWSAGACTEHISVSTVIWLRPTKLSYFRVSVFSYFFFCVESQNCKINLAKRCAENRRTKWLANCRIIDFFPRWFYTVDMLFNKNKYLAFSNFYFSGLYLTQSTKYFKRHGVSFISHK